MEGAEDLSEQGRDHGQQDERSQQVVAQSSVYCTAMVAPGGLAKAGAGNLDGHYHDSRAAGIPQSVSA